MPHTQKPRVATVSLAGCFGCHMSLLDLDERFLQLTQVVEFGRSPLNDLRRFKERCRVGLIEGGCCNEENVKTLVEFREHCDVLIAVGECAIMGGIPAMRNTLPLVACLDEAYLEGPSVYNPSGRIPDDPELPLLLDKVYCAHDVVKIDYYLPGCPPQADTLWQALVAVLSDNPVNLPYELVKYD